jgi:hypothetical protein
MAVGAMDILGINFLVVEATLKQTPPFLVLNAETDFLRFKA